MLGSYHCQMANAAAILTFCVPSMSANSRILLLLAESPEDPSMETQESKGKEDVEGLVLLAEYIHQAAEDASYHVRTTAFGLAMEWVSRHQDMVMRQIGRQAAPPEVLERESSDSPVSRILNTLARGSNDPLRHLKETVGDFVIRTFKDSRIRNCPLWHSFYAHLPPEQSTESDADQAQFVSTIQPTWHRS
jgi:hypothetical protein